MAREMLKGVISAAVYGVALYFLRDLSSAHWYLPAGLRFAALLTLPRRYWAYLYAGECLSLLTIRMPLIESRGLAWAIVSTFTAFPPVAGVVHLLRRRSAAPCVASGRDVLAILLGAGAVALMATGINTATTYTLMHGRPSNPVPYVVGIWVLGQYLGILMFASVALLWTNRSPRHPMPSPLLRESVVAAGLVGACVALFRLAPSSVAELLEQPIRLAAAILAVALTYRHGWRGGAVGALALTLGVGMTAGPDYDQATLLAQQVVAFVASALLAAGAVMTHNYEIAMTESASRRQAEEAGRRAWHDSEEQNLEHVSRAQAAYGRIMRQGDNIIGDLRQAKRPEDVMRLTTDLMATTRTATAKLMHEIYPTVVFSSDGLFGALRGRPAPAGVRYKTVLTGNSSDLSRATCLSVYRAAGAAIDFLADLQPATVALSARVFHSAGQHWVYVRVRADVTATRTNASTASLARLRRRVIALGGVMRNDGRGMSFLLPDEASATVDGRAGSHNRKRWAASSVPSDFA